MKLEYIATKQDENIKLKYILKNRLNISSSLLIKLKNNKCIFVNDNKLMVNEFVKENDVITVYLDNIDKEENISNVVLYDKPLDIIYEDEYILVINKPSGIPVHPSANNFDKTIANMVMNYYVQNKYNINKIHIVTRLDKDTSGICIIAKNEYVQNILSIKGNIQKEYIAIVNGIIKKDHDIIEKNIARKENTIILREVNDNGDYSKTEYFVLNRNVEKNYTVIKVLLHTGRTHQIRVHMAYLGHVLLRR